jgi:DNA-binding CsgD family transcriptional regulator
MELTHPDIDQLPPDCLLDGFHPAADEYMRATKRIQRLIVSASAKLKPKQVEAVKQHHSGDTHVRIAERLGVTPNTISKYIKAPTAQHLLNLLRAYQSAIDGPNKAQRINMLWRIASRNEIDSPSTAIKALAEINRMDESLIAANHPGTNTGNVTIEINPVALPKTALDQDIPDNVVPLTIEGKAE